MSPLEALQLYQLTLPYQQGGTPSPVNFAGFAWGLFSPEKGGLVGAHLAGVGFNVFVADFSLPKKEIGEDELIATT